MNDNIKAEIKNILAQHSSEGVLNDTIAQKIAEAIEKELCSNQEGSRTCTLFETDFCLGTWTFELPKGMLIKAGKYNIKKQEL